jgi:broad specificity phosphatase PhoE
MMRMFFMRHGETDWNRERRVQGRQDVALNDRGREQVRRAAERLSHRMSTPFSRIVSSPLLRARQSAIICRDLLRLPMEVDTRWAERSFGRLEGMTVDEIRRLCHIDDFEEIYDRLYGVEAMDSVRSRIRQALTDAVAAVSAAGPILIVTHGSIIKCLARECGMEYGIPANGEWIELSVEQLNIEGNRCRGGA